MLLDEEIQMGVGRACRVIRPWRPRLRPVARLLWSPPTTPALAFLRPDPVRAGDLMDGIGARGQDLIRRLLPGHTALDLIAGVVRLPQGLHVGCLEILALSKRCDHDLT
jgi:hypothetical protein